MRLRAAVGKGSFIQMVRACVPNVRTQSTAVMAPSVGHFWHSSTARNHPSLQRVQRLPVYLFVAASGLFSISICEL